jgi:AraC-like DNA-binding protein
MHEDRHRQHPPPSVQVRRIRTDAWPAREREAMFRELFGGDTIRVEPHRDEPLRIDATVIRYPGLAFVWGRRSPLRSDFTDGSDRLMFSLAGPAVARQFGRELLLDRGDAVALSGADHGTLTTLRTGRIATLEFPRGTLLSMLDDPRRRCAQRISKDSPALQLLRGYLRAVQPTDITDAVELPPMVIAHIHDLAAMAVGAGRATEQAAKAGGVRGARLRAIKNDLLANAETDLSIDALAARHRVSARYVRMLFEADGLSVTEFVREERLKRARAMLLSPRFADRRISEIAYQAGFNDVSYFNRCFRRRFGQPPSALRGDALSRAGSSRVQ